jgi:hypothetical protein
MANLSSAVKKNSGSKHTRKELMNKSPIPWIVIIVAFTILGGVFVFPDATTWLSQRDSVNELSDSIPVLESEKQALSNEKGNLDEDFLKLTQGEVNEEGVIAIDYNKLANQRFPDSVDTTRVAQIMEIYSVLMQKMNRGNDIKLSSLSINQAQNIDGLPYAQNSMSLNMTIDRTMLKELIAFIQTGEITNELENKVIQTARGEGASIEFLKDNKLPVATIASLSLNESTNLDDLSSREIYSAQIQVFLYSQPI